MKRSWLQAVEGLFLAALLSSPAWGSIPPQPGTVNYIEGQAAIGAQSLTDKSVGTVRLTAGRVLSTDDGRAEILLTPGIFLRVAAHSAVQMVSPDLENTVVNLQKGRAMVEVAAIRPANNVRVTLKGADTQLLKPGLYDFDADHGTVRVFDGKAAAQAGGKTIELGGAHELALNTSGKLKSRKFDKKEAVDDFYRWGSLRSSYLAEANVDAARTYSGGGGYAAQMWNGNGWYWDPWFAAYTFIPGDGIFYDPFGWGFYSPWMAWDAPYFGYGFGYGLGFGGYGYGYGYGGGRYHRFGPGYHGYAAATGRGPGYVGHAYSVRGGAGMGAMSRGGFGGGGFRGGAGAFRGGGFGGGGFRGGGGGFHGGGGGGFHGGGGGGHGR